jgi:hypothetical protein
VMGRDWKVEMLGKVDVIETRLTQHDAEAQALVVCRPRVYDPVARQDSYVVLDPRRSVEDGKACYW